MINISSPKSIRSQYETIPNRTDPYKLLGGLSRPAEELKWEKFDRVKMHGVIFPKRVEVRSILL